MTTRPNSKPTAGKDKRRRKGRITPEERYVNLQEEAYRLAEKDGFKKDPVDYWLAAEAEGDS